jgi:hypothetical protein
MERIRYFGNPNPCGEDLPQSAAVRIFEDTANYTGTVFDLIVDRDRLKTPVSYEVLPE